MLSYLIICIIDIKGRFSYTPCPNKEVLIKSNAALPVESGEGVGCFNILFGE
jgi:hypothetical protein